MKAGGSTTLDDAQKAHGDCDRRRGPANLVSRSARDWSHDSAQRRSVYGDWYAAKSRPRRQHESELAQFVPFHAMQDYFRPLNTGIATDVISFINYQPKSRALHEAAQQEVHKMIARNHGFDSEES